MSPGPDHPVPSGLPGVDFGVLAELTPDALGVHRDGVILWANAACARLLAAPDAAALVGRRMLDFVVPEHRAQVAERARAAAGGAGPQPPLRETFLRLDGTRVEVEATAVSVGDGKVFVIVRDVERQARAEREGALLQERLRQAEKLEAVGRLAGGVAHDFNNILSGILGYAELTSMEVDRGSELFEHQQRIREAALRARDLVRQILTFSRRDRSDPQTVDFPAVVNEALALMRAGIPATVTLSTRIDGAAGAVLADPTQLHQVVLNLCSNARDAIGTYGRIEVSVERVGDGGEEGAGLPPGPFVRLRVQDDGVGMDEATRAHIFEPFMTTKGPRGGHGLGLAVVHGIVAGAGGQIRVESAPGRGSTFDVYLPRRELEERPPPPPPARAPPTGDRILLVDDEPTVLSAHRRLLESLGYAVVTARDGEEALARFRETPDEFALVLTDQTMPKISGSDLARAVFTLRPGTRVLLCTGYSDRIDAVGARRLGIRAMLEKPIDRDTLAATLARLLAEP